MRKNENSGFYLSNFAKIREKWPTLSRLYRGKMQSYKRENFGLKVFCLISIHGMF